jgi:hypothetical protein
VIDVSVGLCSPCDSVGRVLSEYDEIATLAAKIASEGKIQRISS